MKKKTRNRKVTFVVFGLLILSLLSSCSTYNVEVLKLPPLPERPSMYDREIIIRGIDTENSAPCWFWKGAGGGPCNSCHKATPCNVAYSFCDNCHLSEYDTDDDFDTIEIDSPEYAGLPCYDCHAPSGESLLRQC